MPRSKRNHRPGGLGGGSIVHNQRFEQFQSKARRAAFQADYTYSVNDGTTLLGHAVELSCGRWEAVTADRRSLGTYSDRRAAEDAILDASGKRVFG